MQFSTSSAALAAVLMAGDVLAACPPRPLHSQHPTSGFPFAFSIPSSPFGTGRFSFPGTSVATPTTSSSAAVVTTLSTSSVAVVVTPSSSSSSTLAVVTTLTTSTSAAAITPSSTTTSSSSAAAATTSAASSGLSSDQTNALDTQNSARSDVGAAALTWSAQLASDAQSWADHLASLGTPGTLVHASGTGEGENLYWQSNSGSPYDAAAEAWVAEKSSYNGEAISDDSAFETYGHYSMSSPHNVLTAAHGLHASVYISRRCCKEQRERDRGFANS